MKTLHYVLLLMVVSASLLTFVIADAFMVNRKNDSKVYVVDDGPNTYRVTKLVSHANKCSGILLETGAEIFFYGPVTVKEEIQK